MDIINQLMKACKIIENNSVTCKVEAFIKKLRNLDKIYVRQKAYRGI